MPQFRSFLIQKCTARNTSANILSTTTIEANVALKQLEQIRSGAYNKSTPLSAEARISLFRQIHTELSDGKGFRLLSPRWKEWRESSHPNWWPPKGYGGTSEYFNGTPDELAMYHKPRSQDRGVVEHPRRRSEPCESRHSFNTRLQWLAPHTQGQAQ